MFLKWSHWWMWAETTALRSEALFSVQQHIIIPYIYVAFPSEPHSSVLYLFQTHEVAGAVRSKCHRQNLYSLKKKPKNLLKNMIFFFRLIWVLSSPRLWTGFLSIRLHFNIPLKTRKFFVKSVIQTMVGGTRDLILLKYFILCRHIFTLQVENDHQCQQN